MRDDPYFRDLIGGGPVSQPSAVVRSANQYGGIARWAGEAGTVMLKLKGRADASELAWPLAETYGGSACRRTETATTTVRGTKAPPSPSHAWCGPGSPHPPATAFTSPEPRRGPRGTRYSQRAIPELPARCSSSGPT